MYYAKNRIIFKNMNNQNPDKKASDQKILKLIKINVNRFLPKCLLPYLFKRRPKLSEEYYIGPITSGNKKSKSQS